MACCENYKAYILKYVPCILKYMPCIFGVFKYLKNNDLQNGVFEVFFAQYILWLKNSRFRRISATCNQKTTRTFRLRSVRVANVIILCSYKWICYGLKLDKSLFETLHEIVSLLHGEA